MDSNKELKVLREQLRVAVYHEIGHAIATLLYFPHSERMKGIEIVRNANGSYGFDTDFSSHNCKPDTELHGMTMIAFAGGVFQQMIYLSHALNSDICKIGKEGGEYDSVYEESIQRYYERNVEELIEGMEVDIAIISLYYEKLHEAGKIKNLLDMGQAKNEAIKLLMPFVNVPEVHSLCEHCLDIFVECGMNGRDRALVGTDVIESYIGPLIETSKKYNTYGS